MRESIQKLLRNLRGPEQLRQLFRQELNYDLVTPFTPLKGWSEGDFKDTVDSVYLFAQHEDFKILYIRMHRELSRAVERVLVTKLLQSFPYALFVFSDQPQLHWHFVNVKYERDDTRRRIFRRITIEPGERLRTATDRLAMLDLETLSRDLFGIPPLSIQQRHDQAFDVEAVTLAFYNDYRTQFNALQSALTNVTGDQEWAHDYALQFINRVMFLYFVQRKRWLKKDPEFLANFWKEYQATSEVDRFVKDWLHVLFFEAFNNRFARRSFFSNETNDALYSAPWLNGGLFRENDLDQKYELIISDAQFQALFEMLEHYNFTIREDSPLDQEVAVDPEMIGKVYESLVNVSTEADERGDIGIFYTPRTEIDLMCRLTLVDHLSQRLGAHHRSTLYEFVFAIEPQDRQQVDEQLVPQNLWQPLGDALRSLTLVDPACGSGAFLVGMLIVLDDLNERANRRLGVDETPGERRRRIIRDSLYGVDVMAWAVDIAELRLWLQLVVETEYKPEELKVRALLPDLSFKVRQGDSLVQEVAGINLSNMRGSRDVPPHIKGRITQLKSEKLKAYQNVKESERKFTTTAAIRQEELAIFRDLLAHRVSVLVQREKVLNAEQAAMFGAITAKPSAEMQELAAEIAQARAAQDALRTTRDVPFAWEIAFVEIFTDERAGFDIVIGNPPYVRQERIADPLHRQTDKKRYKDKLARSVYQDFPAYFGFNPRTGKASHPITSKSDLYIYFFFHGLDLLSKHGSFCFVTSNSWLDVGYGADLQEFLLRQGHVRLLIDNKTRRTFANADVNSSIALLGPPKVRPKDSGLRETARFVLFSTPFEDALDAAVWNDIEAVATRTTRQANGVPQYRVFPIGQDALLRDSIASSTTASDEADAPKAGEYAGNKWGGKYLRAPDIYYTLLERGKDKLVRLGDVAEVRFGIKTGANEFFYLDKERIGQWGIEERFLKPVIKSPRECRAIVANRRDFQTHVFMCDLSKADLTNTSALEYIQWGEQQGFHLNPSCRSRRQWWTLGIRLFPNIVWVKSVNDVHRQSLIPFEALVDQRLYEITSQNADNLNIVLNSATTILMKELEGRVNLGEGVLDTTVYEAKNIWVANPNLLNTHQVREVYSVMSERLILPIRQELELSDRHDLDAIVFDALGLTQGERDGVYEAVIDLVEARLNKAASFRIVKAFEE